MGLWWNGTDRGKPKVLLEENRDLGPHYSSHMDWSSITPWPAQWVAATNRPIHSTTLKLEAVVRNIYEQFLPHRQHICHYKDRSVNAVQGLNSCVL